MSGSIEPEDLMYMAYGRAMSSAHGLEGDFLSLALLLGIHSRGGVGSPDIQDLDNRLSRRTLGALLHELERRGYVNSDTHETWYRAIAVRNRLAHRFFLDRVEEIVRAAGQQAVTAELERIDHFLTAVQQQVRAVIPVVWEALGLDKEDLQNRVEQEKRRILSAGDEAAEQRRAADSGPDR